MSTLALATVLYVYIAVLTQILPSMAAPQAAPQAEPITYYPYYFPVGSRLHAQWHSRGGDSVLFATIQLD